MAVCNVRQLGDEILTKKCKEVKSVTPRIKQIIGDMYDTMYEANGVGLAAPQIGILKKIVVIDIGDEHQYTLINPVITFSEGSQSGYEGCLSYAGMSGMVTRPDHVIVHAMDADGNEFDLEGNGLLARAICHECDHLDGKMYVDLVEGEIYTNEQLDEMFEKEAAEAEAAQEQK